MSAVDAVIDKLRSEGLCHKNELTGCEIWTGEFNRAHEPKFGNVEARDYMYQAASGEVVMRGEHVKTTCENAACILPAHLVKEEKQRKVREQIPEEYIKIVEDLYFQQGKRIDAIAEERDWPRSYVTRLVAEARSRREIAK